MKGYYNNNQIGYEVNYKNGIKHGKHTMYYENGNLSEEGNFIDGKEEGKWVVYDEEGNITDEDIYKDDQCVEMCEGSEND